MNTAFSIFVFGALLIWCLLAVGAGLAIGVGIAIGVLVFNFQRHR